MPAIDGEKARRNARALLLNARTLDNITPESLSRSWGLTPAVAEQMHAEEKARRARQPINQEGEDNA